MSEHHHHSHAHHHGSGGHSHAPASFGLAFGIGIALNAGFVVAEVVFGLLGHSMALLADAGHNLSDVLGLGIAWVASVLVRRGPTPRFTYGFGGSSILAALFNAVFLMVVIGGLSWEAIIRLMNPGPVAGETVMAVAAGGIVVNSICAWLFAAGRDSDLNIKGVFTHMAADAVVSLGVVIAGLVIMLTGWVRVDPVVSLLVNAIIIWGTWGLLRDSMAMSLSAVPPDIDSESVGAFLKDQPGVQALHDLHIWGMSTTETALTAHLVMPEGHPGDDFLMEICGALKTRHRIGHATIQIETNPESSCALAPANVI